MRLTKPPNEENISIFQNNGPMSWTCDDCGCGIDWLVISVWRLSRQLHVPVASLLYRIQSFAIMMSFFRVSAILGTLALPLFLASCGTSTPKGLPRNLPVINLRGTPETPAHSMARKDYPFDSGGNYVTAWAAEGESAASASDVARWQASHGGSVSRKQPSRVTKVTSKKKTSSSGRSSSYTIKSGDTLGAIARKNGTTVAKIKAANGLKSDMIRAGKTLKIPK